MRSRNHRSRPLPVITLLLLALLLTACGASEDDSPVLQAVEYAATDTPAGADAAGQNAPFAGLQPPPVGTLDLPQAENVPGRILFVRGEKLYAGSFDGAGMVVVASDLTTNSFLPAPDGRIVFFGTTNLQQTESSGISRSGAPALVDLTSRQVQVFPSPTGYTSVPLLSGWLPSGQALGWDRARGINVIDPAAEEPIYLGGLFDFAWTADNRVLLVDDDEQDTHIEGEPKLFVVDPLSGERTALDIPVEPPLRDFLTLEDELAAQDIHFADNYHDYHRIDRLPDGTVVAIEHSENVAQRGMPFCQTWRVLAYPPDAADGAAPTVIYQTPETTHLTDLTALPDGSVLFLRWKLTGCEFMGAMQVELLRVLSDEETIVLTDQINPGQHGNANDIRRLAYESGRKYDVSPDGRYVVWIGGGLDEGSSSLNVIDLETGDMGKLLAQPVSASGSNYIEAVHWVPQ